MNPTPIRRDEPGQRSRLALVPGATRADGRPTIGRWALTAGWLLAGCLGVVEARPTPRLADAAAVREAVRHHIESERLARGIGFAVIHDGQVDSGLVGPLFDPGADPATARFEIGSITKTLTAWLAAERVAAGHASWQTTLGELAPADAALSPPVAAITLEALARHRSGLPRLSPRRADLWRGLVASPSDPYAGSTEAEIWAALAAVAAMPATASTRYSNLGYAALGQALATQAGRDFESLLRESVLAPHGLDGMVLSMSGRVVPGQVVGTGRNGLDASPWHLDAHGPAGGLVATVEDMLAYAAVLLDPPPPLASLLEAPAGLADAEASISGLGFAHRMIGGRHVRWHNGGTGGFHSFLAVVPEERYALVLLGSAGESLDGLAMHLLDPERPAPVREFRWMPWVFMALGLLLAPLAMLAVARAGLHQRPGKPRPDRIALVAVVMQLLFLAGIARALGDWSRLGEVPWWIAIVVTAGAGLVALVRFLPGLPWNTRGFGANLARLVGLGVAALLAAMFLRG